VSNSRRTIALGAFAVVIASMWSSSVVAANLGQKDDFEATLGGWQVGSSGTGQSPRLETTGGPAGAGDGYMRLQSFGNVGALGKLVVFNQSTWSGPYTSFDAISMDLANLGQSTVQMRIALTDTGGGQFVYEDPIMLAPGGQWRDATFVLDADNFVSLTGGNFATALNNIREIRLLHSANAGGIVGDTFAATVGVDNIEAVIIPEPGIALTCAVAAVAMLGRRRRA
jgi:hypothetical protein